MILHLQEEIDQAIIEVVIDFQISPLIFVEEHPGSPTEGLYEACDILGNIGSDNLSQEAFTAYPTDDGIHYASPLGSVIQSRRYSSGRVRDSKSSLVKPSLRRIISNLSKGYLETPLPPIRNSRANLRTSLCWL